MTDRNKVINELEQELDSVKSNVEKWENRKNYKQAESWYRFQEGIERCIWLVKHNG